MRGIVKDILYCAADTKGGLRRKGVLLTVYCIVSRGYQGWSEGEGVIVKGILYRVADTKGGLRGRGTFKGILYRVADTKRGVRGNGLLLRVYCIVSRIPRVV